MLRVGVFFRGLLFGVATLAAGTGCDPDPPKVDPGKLTVTLTPHTIALPGLTLDSVTAHIRGVQVYGDVPPTGPPPDPDHLDFNPATDTPVSLTWDSLRQGIYSRVRLNVAQVNLSGSWRSTPLTIDLGRPPNGMGPPPGPNEGLVDLRSATGKELAPGEDVAFTVDVDAPSWLDATLLDSAVAQNGEIHCNQMDNEAVAAEVMQRVLYSFSLP